MIVPCLRSYLWTGQRDDQCVRRNYVHHFIIIVGQKGDRGTLFSSSTSTTCTATSSALMLHFTSLILTNTMHIRLDRTRHLIVDDQTDILHVNATSREVSGYQDVSLSRPQRLQRSLALLLSLARMQCSRRPLRRTKPVCQRDSMITYKEGVPQPVINPWPPCPLSSFD